MFSKPTICTEICEVGFVGELESSMERVRILAKFDIRMVDHFGKARGNLVEGIIPERLDIRITIIDSLNHRLTYK